MTSITERVQAALPTPKPFKPETQEAVVMFIIERLAFEQRQIQRTSQS